MPQNPNQGELFNQNPHSGELIPDSELVQPAPGGFDPNPGPSVPLDKRNIALIQALDNIAQARKDDGFYEASQPSQPANRARLSAGSRNIDKQAENAYKRSRRLKSEARALFDESTGVQALKEAGVEEIDGVDPDVLIISYWKNLSDKVKNTKDLQRLRAKLSKNLDAMNQPRG